MGGVHFVMNIDYGRFGGFTTSGFIDNCAAVAQIYLVWNPNLAVMATFMTMEITILGAFWITASFAIAVAYALLKCCKALPQCFQDFVLFGKLRNKRVTWSVIQLLEIPKKSFVYFYLVGTIVSSSFAALTCYCYLNGVAYPSILILLSHLITCKHVPSSQEACLVPMLLGCLMMIQNVRRLYETLSISIYSESTINIFHFLFGIMLYTTFPLIVMSGASSPDLCKGVPFNLKYSQVFGIGLFIWSSYNQTKASITLAKLRLHSNGKLKSMDHFVPTGGHFDLISCPHYLMEILIYISFSMVHSFANTTLNCLVIFVATNQAFSALFTHSWYKDNFKNYPINRKALIPFIL